MRAPAPPPWTEPRFVQGGLADEAQERAALAAGLLAPQAQLEPKWFYDAQGAKLFDAITALDEYYPTRTERRIFDTHAAEMATSCGTGLTLVDLGAGDGAKAERLFPALRPAAYVAVDISTAHLRAALNAMQARHPALNLLGVGTDFSRTLNLPPPGPARASAAKWRGRWRRRGVRTVLVARREPLLDSLAEEMRAAGYPAARVLPLDLYDRASPQRVAECLATLGPADILINDAGGSRPMPVDAADEAWDESFAINFTALRKLAQALMPSMIARRWGAHHQHHRVHRTVRRQCGQRGQRQRSTHGPRGCREWSVSTRSPSTPSRPGRIHSEQIGQQAVPPRVNRRRRLPGRTSRWATSATRRTWPTWRSFFAASVPATSRASASAWTVALHRAVV